MMFGWRVLLKNAELKLVMKYQSILQIPGNAENGADQGRGKSILGNRRKIAFDLPISHALVSHCNGDGLYVFTEGSADGCHAALREPADVKAKRKKCWTL